MGRNAIAALVVILSLATGCAGAGVASYQRIDMGQNLDAATVARYQAETKLAVAAGEDQQMPVLEHSNWWPLGILAYWQQGTVQAMHDSDGKPVYMISQSTGYGPLSLFWVDGTDAMFAADGTRLSMMDMSSILGCHFLMLHNMGTRSPQGQWWEHSSVNLFCHMININTMHGQTSWSLITTPGPVGSGR